MKFDPKIHVGELVKETNLPLEDVLDAIDELEEHG